MKVQAGIRRPGPSEIEASLAVKLNVFIWTAVSGAFKLVIEVCPFGIPIFTDSGTPVPDGNAGEGSTPVAVPDFDAVPEVVDGMLPLRPVDRMPPTISRSDAATSIAIMKIFGLELLSSGGDWSSTGACILSFSGVCSMILPFLYSGMFRSVQYLLIETDKKERIRRSSPERAVEHTVGEKDF